MDLITIKFIGLVLLFHTVAPSGKVNFMMFAVDATPDKSATVHVCNKDIPAHHAYLRIVGDTVSVSWQTRAIPCETEGPEPNTGRCFLYELDHDDLSITGVSDDSGGVTVTSSLGLVPRLKEFFGSGPAKLTAQKAHDNSAATLSIKAGALFGVPEFNDMRTMRLDVRQPEIPIDEVTITSKKNAKNKIVVPAGSQIAIINMMPDDAADQPGNHSSEGHEEDWFLHFTLLDNEPTAGCKHPISDQTTREEHSDDKMKLLSLNKACSPTTFP
jgi:hypothetical protein